MTAENNGFMFTWLVGLLFVSCIEAENQTAQSDTALSEKTDAYNVFVMYQSFRYTKKKY